MVQGYLTDKNGNKRKVQEHSNAIFADFYGILAQNLESGIDFALDDLFLVSESPPTLQKDGIFVTTTTPVGQRSLVTTLSEPSSSQLRATGVFTNGTGSTVVVAGFPYLGKYYGAVGGLGAFVDFVLAWDTAWSSVSVPNGETLTIVWTITFTAH